MKKEYLIKSKILFKLYLIYFGFKYKPQCDIFDSVFDRFKDFTPFINELAVLNGNYEHPEGPRCAFDYMIRSAVKNNYIGLLKYLYSRIHSTYDYSFNLCELAVENDALEALIYLRKRKCRCDSYIYQIALNNKSKRCLEYLSEQGFSNLKPKSSMYVPLNFWYSAPTSMSIPYSSLSSSNVSFNLTFNHPISGINWALKNSSPTKIVRKYYPKTLLLTNG